MGLSGGDQRLQFVPLAPGADQPHGAVRLLGRLDRGVLVLLVIDQDRAARVIENVGDVGCRRADVERHQHRTGEWHRVMAGEHHVGISRQQRDAIAGRYAEPLQCPRELQIALEELRVGETRIGVDHPEPVAKNLRRPAQECGRGERLETDRGGHA